MDKQYTSKITLRTPRPRSERLREQGIGGGATTVVMNVAGAGGSTVTGDGHTHSNLSALNEISTDRQGYMYLTQIREKKIPKLGK